MRNAVKTLIMASSPDGLIPTSKGSSGACSELHHPLSWITGGCYLGYGTESLDSCRFPRTQEFLDSSDVSRWIMALLISLKVRTDLKYIYFCFYVLPLFLRNYYFFFANCIHSFTVSISASQEALSSWIAMGFRALNVSRFLPPASTLGMSPCLNARSCLPVTSGKGS